MFDSPSTLLLGLISGILFGFLLQKGRVAKFRVIVGQFLFTDWTVVKIMLTAVAVGAVGVWTMIAMGWTELHIKPAAFAGVIIGGLLFGVGMATFGYCPGTSVAACGEGRRDAMVGVAGMLFGALVFVFAYPSLEGMIKAWGDWGKVTLPQVTGISPWIYIAGLVVATVLIRLFAERNRTSIRPDRIHR
ncbi:MAG: YeeE/YedE thiosulfate transporter family protein [Chthoniobacteraceae bacterium]